MSLATFLIGLVGPLAARWIAAMGLSLITLTGLVIAFDQVKAQVIENVGGLPAKALQLGGLFGIFEAIGMVLGAAAFVIAWRQAAGFWKLAKA